MRVREYGREFPERPLMGRISDLLDISHFSTANGGTVRRDFLEATGLALGFTYEELRGMRTKEDLVEALVRATNEGRFYPEVLSTEGNVTNDALELIASGIERAAVTERIVHEAMEAGVAVPVDRQPHFIAGVDDGSDVEDMRRLRLTSIAVRDGQNRFRSELLRAYEARCAVTGTDAADVLEAAHISPYRGPHSNYSANGLILRADIHTLFDRGALAVDESTLELRFARHLRATTYSALIEARPVLREPSSSKDRPSRQLLRAHRLWSGL